MSLFSLITSHMPLALPRTLSAAISSPATPRTPSPIGVRGVARPQLIGCLHLVHLLRHVFPCKLRKDAQDADFHFHSVSNRIDTTSVHEFWLKSFVIIFIWVEGKKGKRLCWKDSNFNIVCSKFGSWLSNLARWGLRYMRWQLNRWLFSYHSVWWS